MPIFSINASKLIPIKETDLGLEKEIQRLSENNLTTVFGLQFICTEFALGNFRIDTLAYNKESKSFVIIEYKKDRSFSVIDQGYSYLSLMLNNKAEFILEYNEKTGESLKRNDIDWSQSRVIFIAKSFTVHQQNAINFKDLPIELWEVKKFDNSTILYNQLLSSQSQESVKTISKNKIVAEVTKEVKVYTVDDHLQGKKDNVKEIFELLKTEIIGMHPDIKEVPTKLYIAYKLDSNIVDVEVRSKDVKVFINLKSGELYDPQKKARDLTKPKLVGHWGNGDYEVVIKTLEEVPYVVSLIYQTQQRIHLK